MSLSDDKESFMSNIKNENKEDDPSNETNLDLNKGEGTTNINTLNLNKDYEQSSDYNFGWNRYSEITNGRFAMIGFLSILIIELISKKSFFDWAGIFN